ncbi:hypothetical protein [Halomonas sp. 11-S5]|nr:hypothetical protein [Halomonas sp. 11-S5]
MQARRRPGAGAIGQPALFAGKRLRRASRSWEKSKSRNSTSIEISASGSP